MNNAKIIHRILEAIQQVREENLSYGIISLDKSVADDPHEFLFFVKPEITFLSDIKYQEALFDLVFNKIEAFKLRIRDIRIISASYLDQYDIIARHYGVINALSRNPSENLTSEAHSRFREVFGKDTGSVSLLGSLEFLRFYKDYNVDGLDKLWQQAKSVKLAGGTYCACVSVKNEDVYLINGFHPRQLLHFTEPGRCIVTLTLSGNLDWSVARNSFIGKTNPADAQPGSLRNEILVKKGEFGIQDVSASQNGFHLSAGPLEGLVELMRYCSDFSTGILVKEDNYVFGRMLKSNFDEATIAHFCSNKPVSHHGAKTSPFDLTEEKNCTEALQALRTVFL